MDKLKETLKQFWKDANSYQSIDPACFNIDEYTENWIENAPIKGDSQKTFCEDCSQEVIEINQIIICKDCHN